MLEKLKRFLARPPVRYLAGIGAVGLALLLREILTSRLGPDFPEYLMFYPTVMLVALLAGIWPALLAIVAAAALIFIFWYVPGRPPLLMIGTSNYVGLVLFMVVCAFLSFVAELYRRSRSKAAAYDKEQAQRETQEALRRQAEMLKLSFDAIIVWRVGGVIESWNRGAEELYGYTEEEALGRGIHELLRAPAAPWPQAVDPARAQAAPTPTPAPWREFEKTLQRAGEWFGEVQHVTKEGRDVVVSSRQLVGRGLDGAERVLEIDRDITDEKRVEEELRRAHDELEEKVERRTADLQRANRTLLMVSACDQALVQISDESELTGVICQIIQDEGGYPLVWVGLLEDGRGSLRCVASAGDRDGYLDSLRAAWGDDALAGGPIGTAVLSNAPVVRDDIAELAEEAHWTGAALARGYRSVAVFPLLNARKQAFGALVIHSEGRSGFEQRQVTLLKELADDLAFGIASVRARAERDQAQRALELKATQLQTLAGEIVRTEQRERQRIAQLLHDQIQQLLVATLYGLEGFTEPRAVTEYQESAKAMSGLVRECITVSRSLASELSHPAFTEPDLCTALGWLGTWTLDKHGVKVTVTCGEKITAEVEETRVSLLQAIRELLFNVVKHAGVREARVDLARTPEGHVSVAVSDSGVGFEPRSALAPGRPAGGIGLFSMRERLDVIGGGMTIESGIGRGTRVTVWVPADGAPAAIPAALPEGGPAEETRGAARGRAARRVSGKIRVLLVDDHAVVRNGIALQLLQQPDIEVVGEAADGRKAVEMVRSLRPDVVTMDVNMPGMNGVDAARAIHAEFPGTRIIGLSMSDESEQGAAMRTAGAEHYLSKSESLDKLLAAIRAPSDRE
jgi:signal transduction histidine kinase/CheY-like chemotaxis protein/PAS domain-containing protein